MEIWKYGHVLNLRGSAKSCAQFCLLGGFQLNVLILFKVPTWTEGMGLGLWVLSAQSYAVLCALLFPLVWRWHKPPLCGFRKKKQRFWLPWWNGSGILSPRNLQNAIHWQCLSCKFDPIYFQCPKPWIDRPYWQRFPFRPLMGLKHKSCYLCSFLQAAWMLWGVILSMLPRQKESSFVLFFSFGSCFCSFSN